jgi:hypothetical protein
MPGVQIEMALSTSAGRVTVRSSGGVALGLCLFHSKHTDGRMSRNMRAL